MTLSPSKVLKLVQKYYPAVEVDVPKKLLDLSRLTVCFHIPLHKYRDITMVASNDEVKFFESSLNTLVPNERVEVEEVIYQCADEGFHINKIEVDFNYKNETKYYGKKYVQH